MPKFVNELILYSVVALARRVVIPDDVLASKLERSVVLVAVLQLQEQSYRDP